MADSLLKVGRGRIAQLRLTGSAGKRLMEMGVTPGTEIVVNRIAPLGDPVQVSLRGYALTLRRRDAERIWVEGGEKG